MFKSIRYGYLLHEELIDLSLNPDFALAKDYIFEGLSCRLNPFDPAKKEQQHKINIKPRKNYGPEMEKRLLDNHAQSKTLETNKQIE